MSNGIKFVLLLSAILVVMFSLAFAQAEPFQAEVLVQTARMRWGPGSAFAVQHYANLGHVLTVLEADAESDPPWTWYYARTASGVQSWIRGDLIRRTDAAVPIAARPDNPTGSYPVIDNNLCNTSLFRTCQDGADHDLWEAGYWANDRYDHWERGGWNLNIVYHQNPCKADRVCTTREAWDAGHQEAQMLAATATPNVTVTPVVIQQTVEVEVGVREIWDTFTATNDTGLFGGANISQLYTPPLGLYPATGTRWGEFILNSESISVDCYFWHNAYGDENVKSGRFGVNLGRLRNDANDGEPSAADITASQLNCVSGNINDDQVVARQWKIKVTRSYSGRSQIGGISWTLEGTYGTEPVDETSTTCIVTSCLTAMDDGLYNYVRSSLPTPDPARSARTPRLNFVTEFPAVACTLRTTTSGESPREITRYEHTCKDDDGNLQYTLTFHYTRNETVGFAPQPTATSS